MIDKIDELKMKLIGVIEKNLDKENLTSRELFDYAQILSNLKSAEEYNETLKKTFEVLHANREDNDGGFFPTN